MMPELFDVIEAHSNKATAVAVSATADPGDEVVSLTTPVLPAGEYTLFYAFQVTFAERNQPLFYKLTGDKADADWFSEEASANNALHRNFTYGYPFTHAGGALTIGLNFYRDVQLSSATVDFVDLMVKRVG